MAMALPLQKLFHAACAWFSRSENLYVGNVKSRETIVFTTRISAGTIT
jgi:hypothetical protein